VSDVGAAPKLNVPERHHGHPPQLAQRPGIHTRRAEGRGIIAAAHERILPDPFGLVARVVEVREAEAMPGLVRHGPHRHHLAGVAPVGAPQPALECVIRHHNAPTKSVAGMGGVRSSRQDEPVRPEVVVGRAAASAVHRRLNEHDEVDDAVPVEVVLRPVDLAVDLAQRLPQPALHASDRLIAEQPVTVRIAVRIPRARARHAGVGDLVRVERGVPVALPLHTEQAVRHLLVVAAVRVRTPRGSARGGRREQHVVVLASGAQLCCGRVLELEEERRDAEHP